MCTARRRRWPFSARHLRHIDGSAATGVHQNVERIDAEEQHDGANDQHRRQAKATTADGNLNATHAARKIAAVFAAAVFHVTALAIIFIIAHGVPLLLPKASELAARMLPYVPHSARRIGQNKGATRQAAPVLQFVVRELCRPAVSSEPDGPAAAGFPALQCASLA